jgi:3-hydroxyacyl-[acyl-carrier-protein] dehydratase
MDDHLIKKDITFPIEAEQLVPHRRPVCMIDRLVEFKEKTGVVESLVRSGDLLVDEDGVLDNIAYMELIAQAYAATKGYYDMLHGETVKKGFLVIVKHLECKREAFLGDLLTISVSTVSEIGGFAVAEGTVMRGDEVLATGSMTLWIP